MFESVERLEWESALVKADTRRDYGEVRLRVPARFDGTLLAAVVTPRGADFRVISLRRASRKETRLYEAATR